jgi:hypothetical protein
LVQVSEVSVHGLVAPLLWACGEPKHHGGEGVKEHGIWEVEQDQQEEGRDKIHFKGQPPVTSSLPLLPVEDPGGEGLRSLQFEKKALDRDRDCKEEQSFIERERKV